MATFSGGRFDVLRDPTTKESPEEEEDFDEIPKSSKKAAKKKKKRKKQGQSSEACEPLRTEEADEVVVQPSKQHSNTVAQHHSDHHKTSLQLDNQSKAEALSAVRSRPHPSNMTGKAVGETNQYLEAATSSKKKKKRKNRSANMAGILTSKLNTETPNSIDKGKEKDRDEEYASKRILHSESNVSLPKPTEEEEEETHNHDEESEEFDGTGILHSESNKSLSKPTDDEEGASKRILQSESNASLPRPSEEKEKETHNHDEEGEGIFQFESNISLPKPTDDKEDASTEILSSETNVMLPNPTDEERIEARHGEEGIETRETVLEASSQGQKPFTDLEIFSNEPTLLTKEETKERQNLLQIFGLMFGVGLTALRKLFMDIHPTWSNTPGDALNLDKGTMKLKRNEAASFNKGDINEWDVSLITTVLLYSKKCKVEISKKPGFEGAIRSIKDYKNKLISHPHKDKMSDDDSRIYWPAISGHLETVGASKEEIDMILKENVLEKGKEYRDLFLQEAAANCAVVEEIRQQNQAVTSMAEKVDTIYTIVTNQSGSGQSDFRNQLCPERGGPHWDEWMKLLNSVRNFDHFQNNYVLITDEMSPDLMECYSSLRSVPWKMVLDFDPSSEEKGMYQDFASKDGKNSLINMNTPAEVGRKSLADLARHIDPNKTQWMFVNGREDDGADGGPQDFDDWEDNAVGDISTFLKCCSEPDKLDKNKPLVCLILPFREQTVHFINVTMKRLLENFREFDISFVQVKPKEQTYALPDKLLDKINIRTTDLNPQLLRLGMEDRFHVSSEQRYCMPTSQADVTAKLTQTEYLYLKEYLDLLYEGCEDLANMIDVGEGQKREDLIEEHKKSFMSGNWISFVSLHYNHDARREISNKIRTHVQRLLDQGLTSSTIVEISHSPGSGGSTIARRVMWELHEYYPCAFAKLEDHKFDLEDDSKFLDNLADCISTVQEICHMTPVVLLDGKHTRIEALTNKLVRVLNSRGKRAVLLRCNHNLEDSRNMLESSDIHATFFVNVRLEESKADIKEFESKYKDYIKEFKNIRRLSDLSRVFHFPLFAMLKEFRNKLQEIIYESFDEMTDIEKEIVTVVAFIQRFAAQPIPAPLLYAIFKQSVQVRNSNTSCHNLQAVTYEDISAIMTERLCNLMVPANPAKFIRSGKGFKRPNNFQEMYTLQHPVVSEMVLQKAKTTLNRDTLALTREFLGFPVFDDIRFIPLMKDLFVLNGCGPGRFSVLFEELKVMHSPEAGDVFYEAAEKTKDVVVVTSAARFFAKVPPRSFQKAKELIEKAFDCENAEEKQKTIYDVKGVVLLKELKFLAKSGKIPSLQHLQLLTQSALESFRKAQMWPPSFPNPLIGEVKTWVICIEWITKNIYHGNSIMALHFIMSYDAPPFFRACVSHSFYLLDIVDYIVQSVKSLSDPETTQKEANNVRLSLMKAAFMETVTISKRRNASEIILECKTLCSAEIFRSSPQKELKRLKVLYVFSCVKEIENIDRRGLEYLLKLLEDLVEVEKEDIFANHLMRICLLINGPQEYSLDQGLAICKIWNKKSKYEALPHFYEMMIYFLKILDGDVMEFRARYLNALGNCREKSSHDCRKTMSTHFLGKTGEGMTRLMTRNTLFRGETDYKSSIYDAVYWRTRSRKRLLECRGRIRSRSSGGKKTHLTVELMPGNIELYVAKSAGIGSADRNFVPGSMVHFVVSFNLLGPVANGITFKSSLLPRQLSNS